MNPSDNSEKNAAKHGEELKQLLVAEGKVEIFPIHLLENFPHIADKVFSLWTNPTSINQYFNELLTTNREHRAGFPAEVYSEIFALKALHNEKYEPAQKNDDFWSGVNKRE
jgi:hypothetical protein